MLRGGEIFREGRNTERSLVMALSYYRRACKLGARAGCTAYKALDPGIPLPSSGRVAGWHPTSSTLTDPNASKASKKAAGKNFPRIPQAARQEVRFAGRAGVPELDEER